MKGLEPPNLGSEARLGRDIWAVIVAADIKSQMYCFQSFITNKMMVAKFCLFSAEGTNFVCSASVSVSAGLTPPTDEH